MRNSVILVDQIDQDIAAGHGRFDAIIGATVRRFRPIMLTAAAVSVNIWGLLQLEQNFDPNWYLKEHSYPSEYFNAMKHYFPENGERASVYTGI